MWKYKPHQVEGGQWALDTLREHGLAYLAWEERTGKSGAAIYCTESAMVDRVLIITKKKAISGWQEHIDNLPTAKDYTVINYESVHKVGSGYDFIILDEAHSKIAGFPKLSTTWKNVYKHTPHKPILYLSATPYAESIGQLYPQFKLSSWSPFKRFKNFYDFHRTYGVPDKTRTPYGLIETYKKYRTNAVLAQVEHLFNWKTRADVGIEHLPDYRVIEVDVLAQTQELIKQAIKTEMITIKGETIPLDTPMKLRTTIYMLECGIVKSDDRYIPTGEVSKINYIKTHYKPEQTVIMAHFIGERDLYAKLLPEFKVLSANAFSEGVDLSHYEKLVITSTDFSTSKFRQRLARQANYGRSTPIMVDIIVGKEPCIGKEVVETVGKKNENFTKNSFERIRNHLIS